MMQTRRWKILPRQAQAEAFARTLGVSPIIAQALLNRGIADAEAARQFMQPSLLSLHDPSLLGNMGRAAARVAQAIRAGEKIVIYGDYDVDGIAGTTILWHAIRMLGGSVDYYIPHRVDEGYGINSEAIEEICAGGGKVIISVDCGITALEPAQLARDLGVDLIITDHHEPRPDGRAPECFCIVHPRMATESKEPYPNPHLCGASVALKLAWACGQQFAGGNGRVQTQLRQLLIDATSLAALATIADVVPLVVENRIIAYFGLMGIKQCSLSGVQALLESAGLLNEKVDSYHVGFMLAPRLNACGRMGHAEEAVEMLTRATPERAREIATALEQQNRERQATEKQILGQALDQITELKLDAEEHHAIVVGGEGWHAGVIGIVASRIVDRFHRPAIVVSLENGEGHGSGRSITGFHLANALAAMGDVLDGSGGHEMAAGLQVKAGRFDEFRTRFLQYARKMIAPEMLVAELRIEAEATLDEISKPLVDQLHRLGPFGQGNPRPILCCNDVELVQDPNVVGKSGDHLQLRIRQGVTAMKCIAFRFGRLAGQLRRGMHLDLAVEPTLNTYNGYTNVELDVKDLRVRM
jgi:single-stranded-DNA-specific exonuclease